MFKQLQKRRSAGSASSRSDSTGFTIIEVLVVLAIAGLIMVVVFLAVPALQRSGRNNALNTSANNILTAVGNYISNNGGTKPADITTPVAPSGGQVTIGASGTNQEVVKVDSGVATLQIDNGATQIAATTANIGKIQVVTGTNGVCNSSSTGLATGSGSGRSYAVLYVAEGGSSGAILKCVG